MQQELFIQPKTRVIFDSKKKLFSLLPKQDWRYIIITDSHVETLFGKELEEDFKKEGFDTSLISFPQGEKYKTRETKEKIEDLMLSLKIGKNSSILALGGGITTDLAGFIAATYCRGISLISLPTSLLAMVDASIGGKTGVNTSHGKNLIGSYYPASLVLIDETFLKTLPEKEMKNGFAEIIKYGLIASRSLFEILESGSDVKLSQLIYESVCVKKKIVELDFQENGLRRILNFGHTIGHALETLSKYEIAHGEAIAIGMLFESYLSLKLGFFKRDEFDRLSLLLQRYGFSAHLPSLVKFDVLMEAMTFDKKALSSSPRFVILKSIGEVVPFDGNYCSSVDFSLLYEVYEYFSHSKRASSRAHSSSCV